MSIPQIAVLKPGRRLSRQLITSLAPGEGVIIHVTHRKGAVRTWAGWVVAADSTALRLRAEWYKNALSAFSTSGERVIPWNRVRHLEIVAPAGDEHGGQAS